MKFMPFNYIMSVTNLVWSKYARVSRLSDAVELRFQINETTTFQFVRRKITEKNWLKLRRVLLSNLRHIIVIANVIIAIFIFAM